MTYDQLVFEALAYRRHVGASPGDIRAYVGVRETTRHGPKDDLAALRRLEGAGKLVRVGKKWFLTPEAHKQARGSALEPEWQPEDAWVLLALVYDRESEPSQLPDIIGIADGINHAIPTQEELHGALNRLLAGGLIAVRRDGFAVTDKAVELFDRVELSCKKYVPDQLDGLGRVMQCPCCGVKLKGVRWQINLDERTFRDAVEAYSERVR